MDVTSRVSAPIFPPLPALDHLGGTLAADGRPSLADAARDLEGMFLSLLLKEMRQSLGEEGGLFAGDGADVYGGLFDFYMSQHLAGAGGFGLASTWATGLGSPDRSEDVHDARPGPGLPRPSVP